MRRRHARVGLSSTVLGIAALLFMATSASAQAWLPRQGDGAVAVLYQEQSVDRHTRDDGTRIDRGQTRTHIFAVDLTYGLSDRIAFNVSLPYIASEYTGKNPHTAADFGRTSVLDFGGYHGTAQDFRVDVRYSALRGATAVTPYVSGIIPSHDYDFYGHGAPGRRLGEVQVGAYAGRMLDAVVPGAFVQARYAYGFTQRLLGVRHDRSVANVELGYFVNPATRIFGLADGQISHGGLRFTYSFPYDLTIPERLVHDRLSRINSFNVGGGAQVSLTPSLDLFGSIVHTAFMTNGHPLKYGVTTGVSWSFHRDALPNGSVASRRGGLVKCLCQKGE